MPVERRGQAIVFEIESTGNGRNPIFNGRRQPSCGGTSRMTRECQVRICERLGVKFPGPTRPRRLYRNVRIHGEFWRVSGRSPDASVCRLSAGPRRMKLPWRVASSVNTVAGITHSPLPVSANDQSDSAHCFLSLFAAGKPLDARKREPRSRPQ
jgi:hypothetical protein